MRIITAILDEERDTARLAALRDARCKNDEAVIARALEGTWRDEHLFEPRQAYELYRTYQMKVTECDGQIEQALAKLPDRSAGAKLQPKVKKCHRKPNTLRFEATEPVFRAMGLDLTAMEGIEAYTALVILGEIGVDVSKFPTEKHFASWLGLLPRQESFASLHILTRRASEGSEALPSLARRVRMSFFGARVICPNRQESNRKRKSRRVRKGKNRMAIALRLAARSLERSHSALGAYFRRRNSRLGFKGAITATAHKLARYVYAMLKHGEVYVSQSLEQYEAATQERIERTLRKKARALGYDPVPRQPLTPAVL